MSHAEEMDVNTTLDMTDPLWVEMQQHTSAAGFPSSEQKQGVEEQVGETGQCFCLRLSDSGLGSSLSVTPGVVDLNMSRESSEITNEDTKDTDVKSDAVEEVNMVAYYMARSLAERLVLDNPPAPVLKKLATLPWSSATFIMDRVRANLTKVDKVILMQNNFMSDFLELTQKVNEEKVKVAGHRFVIVQIGLDW